MQDCEVKLEIEKQGLLEKMDKLIYTGPGKWI